jgi:phosphatidate cytidylyltransferase
MRQRAGGAAILVVLLAVVVWLGEPAIAAAVTLIALIGAIELFRLFRAAGYGSFLALGTFLAVAVVAEAAFPGVPDGSGLLLVAVGVILSGVAAFTRPDPREGLTTWVSTVFGALYVGLLAFVIRLGQGAPPLPADAPFAALGRERAWILLLVLVVWAYDTGAYLVGSRVGRRRFLIHISPSKTYAGVVGGLVAATAVAALMLAGLGVAPAHALLLGPLTGLAAQAGDLAESVVKRAAGAKDSGHLLPGHGGMLDRIDSFLFAAPVVTLYVVTLIR